MTAQGVVTAVASDRGFTGFLAGITELVGRFEKTGGTVAGPVAAWLPPVGGWSR